VNPQTHRPPDVLKLDIGTDWCITNLPLAADQRSGSCVHIWIGDTVPSLPMKWPDGTLAIVESLACAEDKFFACGSSCFRAAVLIAS
jgi:hypothetical protein